jgi:SAM-dependent methyltransferase
MGRQTVEELKSPPAPHLPGALHREPILCRSPRLNQVPLAELSGEMLGRIIEGAFDTEATVVLGNQLQDALASALDIHRNRMSRRCYRDVGILPQLALLDLSLDGATVVDVGCGSRNPYGVLFLLLMLGARRGVAIDLDPIQDRERAVKALAECAAMMLVDPHGLVGDYPIERAKVLENIGSFDLARLRAGDATGLDGARLEYRQEAAGQLSIRDSEADLVVSKSFLEHVEDADAVIADLARITRVGGMGIHLIDGVDHRRYAQPNLHPLEFLAETSEAPIVWGCNRIRPLDFVPIFERHGFEVMAVLPYEVIEIDPARHKAMAEPFRSSQREILGVVGARFVVQRKEPPVRGTGVPAADLAAGWRRPSALSAARNAMDAAAKLMHQQRYAEALDVLGTIAPERPEFARAAALEGRIRHSLGDYEGAERALSGAIALPTPSADALVYRAWLRVEQGRGAEARADASQARRLTSPSNPLEIQIRGVFALADAKEGRLGEAMASLDELLTNRTMQGVVHLWRGWAFHYAGDSEQARAAAAAARACDPQLREIDRLMTALDSSRGQSSGEAR